MNGPGAWPNLDERSDVTEVSTRERWRSLPGYERTYLVSTHGRVFSLPRPGSQGGGLLRIGRQLSDGYPSVWLSQDGKVTKVKVYRLVALTFLGPRPRGLQIRHLNGDRLDSRLVNLAYGTSHENMTDVVRHGRHFEANVTHCPQGHEYTPENVYVLPSRPHARYCKACHRERCRLNMRRKRAARRLAAGQTRRPS